MISVRKLILSVFCGIFALLIFVGILALMQYRMADEYNRVITQGGKILFQFNVVKEQISQSLLEKNWQELRNSTRGIEALNSDLDNLLHNNLIPKEYKIAIVNQVDLPGIVLLSGRLLSEPDKQQFSIKLYDQLRLMSDQLMRFDRVLYGEMKAQLIRFQNLAIGVLTVIVATISLLLFFLYQKGFAPMLELSKKLLHHKARISLQPAPGACKEIQELTNQINKVLLNGYKENSMDGSGGFTPESMNIFSNQLNGIINYAQLLIDEKQQGVSGANNITILEKIISSGEIITSVLQEKHIKGEL